MKHSIIALALVAAAAARPTPGLKKREVPQEHSHENIIIAVNDVLFKNNPDDIQDSIFGLLGAAAASEGAGNIADADCLQQATADQAFTNAKAEGDVAGMTNALIYRALERNTGQVGLASVACESIKAVNPEIAALQQHQDPAGEGAQELNKQIAAELARQIAAIGGDPLLANEASTFEPGQLGDPTAAGNTCNELNDDAGCINSQNLRVDDLSEDEIAAAVADIQGGAALNNTGAANNATGAAAADEKKAAADAKKAADKKAADAKKKADAAKKADEKAAKDAAKKEADAAKKEADAMKKAEDKVAKDAKKEADAAKKEADKQAKDAAKKEADALKAADACAAQQDKKVAEQEAVAAKHQ